MFACPGDVARSPAAELLSRDRYGDLGREFASCGIGALAGQGIVDTVAAELHARGIDPTGHRARQASRQLLLDADLVLTMELYQHAWIVEEWPRLASRTFLLKQAARLRKEAARRVDPLAHLGLSSRAADPADDVADTDVVVAH